MKIVKLENGSVLIKDNSNNILKKIDPSAYVQWMSNTTVAILHQGGDLILNTGDISATKVEPNAEAPFSGNAYTLMGILTQDFFNNLGSLENFDLIPGNSVELSYYAGVAAGNPSGTTTNIQTISYKRGVDVVATKTIEYNAADNITKIIIS
jgi:hypothetical protein